MIRLIRYIKERYLYFVMVFLVCCCFVIANIYVRGISDEILDDKNDLIASIRLKNLSNHLVEEFSFVEDQAKLLADFIKSNPNVGKGEIDAFIKKQLSPRSITSLFNSFSKDFIIRYAIAYDNYLSYIYENSDRQYPEILHLKDDSTRYYIDLAKNNPNDVVVQGPFLAPRTHDVVIFCRKAIFVNDNYIGYASVVVDFYKYLEYLKISIEDGDFFYSFRSPIYRGSKDFIWGNNRLFRIKRKGISTTSVFVGKQRWDLAIRVKDTAKYQLSRAYYMVSAVMLVLALVMGFVLVKFIYARKYYNSIDQITGTMSHPAFMNYVNAEMSRKTDHGFIILELLRFKRINSFYGYAIGDKVLNDITQRIRSELNYNDVISRIGTEFIIFVQNIKSTVDVERIHGDLKDALSKPVFVEGMSIEVPVVISSASTITHGRNFSEIKSYLDNRVLSKKEALLKQTSLEKEGS